MTILDKQIEYSLCQRIANNHPHPDKLFSPALRKHRNCLIFPETFWDRVHKTSSCWIWTGRIKFGYGIACVPLDVLRCGNATAHRVSWFLENGEIPHGFCVCHNCPEKPNRLCVRPDHLKTGTDLDNAGDTKRYDRYAKGEHVAGAKLTRCAVLEIREQHDNGIQVSVIALRFEVSQATIYSVINRENWRHV